MTSDFFRTEKAPPALRKMRNWLVGEKTQSWLASQLGVSQPTIFRWVTGENTPGAHFREAMADLSQGQVTFEDWYSDEELQVAFRFAVGPRKQAFRKIWVERAA